MLGTQTCLPLVPSWNSQWQPLERGSIPTLPVPVSSQRFLTVLACMSMRLVPLKIIAPYWHTDEWVAHSLCSEGYHVFKKDWCLVLLSGMFIYGSENVTRAGEISWLPRWRCCAVRIENHCARCLNIWNTSLLIKNPNSLAVGQGPSDLILSLPFPGPQTFSCAELQPNSCLLLVSPNSSILGTSPRQPDSTQQILSGSLVPVKLKNFHPSAKFLLISTWVPQMVANMFF